MAEEREEQQPENPLEKISNIVIVPTEGQKGVVYIATSDGNYVKCDIDEGSKLTTHGLTSAAYLSQTQAQIEQDRVNLRGAI